MPRKKLPVEARYEATAGQFEIRIGKKVIGVMSIAEEGKLTIPEALEEELARVVVDSVNRWGHTLRRAMDK